MKAAFVLLAVVLLVATTQANHAAGVPPSGYSLIGSVLSHLENNSGCSSSDMEGMVKKFSTVMRNEVIPEFQDIKAVGQCLKNPSVSNCEPHIQSIRKVVKLIQTASVRQCPIYMNCVYSYPEQSALVMR